MMDALKPCPHCGGGAYLYGRDNDDGNCWWVACTGGKCVDTHIKQSAQDAIDAWNNREETPEAKELAALKADIEAGRLVRVFVFCTQCIHGKPEYAQTSYFDPPEVVGVRCDMHDEVMDFMDFCSAGDLRDAEAEQEDN